MSGRRGAAGRGSASACAGGRALWAATEWRPSAGRCAVAGRLHATILLEEWDMHDLRIDICQSAVPATCGFFERTIRPEKRQGPGVGQPPMLASPQAHPPPEPTTTARSNLSTALTLPHCCCRCRRRRGRVLLLLAAATAGGLRAHDDASLTAGKSRFSGSFPRCKSGSRRPAFGSCLCLCCLLAACLLAPGPLLANWLSMATYPLLGPGLSAAAAAYFRLGKKKIFWAPYCYFSFLSLRRRPCFQGTANRHLSQQIIAMRCDATANAPPLLGGEGGGGKG